MGLSCTYPSIVDVDRPPKISQPLSAAFRTGPDLDHLRFFHHFLVAAHPPVPYGVSSVWQDVARLAFEYDYLASAILALAAQHLTLLTAADYSVQALRLRVSAIGGVNAALARPCSTQQDADARYACVIALTFQSAYMADAMTDLLTMMRGWMLVSPVATTEASGRSRPPLFRSFTRDSFVESMRTRVAELIRVRQEPDPMTADFCASLRVLAPRCQSVAELRYLSMLENMARRIEESPIEACLEMVTCYASTNKMTTEEFSSFVDPDNHTAQILLAHFFMLDYVLERHAFGAGARPFALQKRVTQSWVVNAAKKLPSSYQRYMMWPLGVAREMVTS